MTYRVPSKKKILTIGACSMALLNTCQLFAQAEDMPLPPSNEGSANGTTPHLFRVRLDSSFTSGYGQEFRGVRQGGGESYSLNLGVQSVVPLSEKWIMPVGLSLQNNFLDAPTGFPVEDAIHTMSLTLGLGHRLSDEWMISANLSPSLYKFDDVGSNDVGFSGGLMAAWNYSSSVRFMFGIRVAPDNDWPVIPMLGVNWRISDELELGIGLPRTRLTYLINKQWNIYGGSEMYASTFRTSDHLGTKLGLPGYDDALGTFRDIRVGLGTSYQLTSHLGLEVEGGYSVSRRIDYNRLDERVKIDSAPYVKAGLSFKF